MLLGCHRHVDGSRCHKQSHGHSGDFCTVSRPRTKHEEQNTRLRARDRACPRAGRQSRRSLRGENGERRGMPRGRGNVNKMKAEEQCSDGNSARPASLPEKPQWSFEGRGHNVVVAGRVAGEGEDGNVMVQRTGSKHKAQPRILALPLSRCGLGPV